MASNVGVRGVDLGFDRLLFLHNALAQMVMDPVTHDGRRYLNHPCPFLDDPPGCRIFSVYPQVCRLWPVNTPVGNGNLYCNSSCPAGRKVVERILKYQAQFG